MSIPSKNDIDRTVDAFLESSQLYARPPHPQAFAMARDLLEPFLVRFWPVLRHYRPEIVGKCLALSFDDPQLGKRSQLHGFGLYMQAGNHCADRDSQLGSYRDDGSYLALQAYDYFRVAAERL